MIFREKPSDFNSTIQVVACYLWCRGRYVLLKRNQLKSYGGKWGLPAGKVEHGESPLDAILREVFEETGISLLISDLEALSPLWVRHEGVDFEYYSFKVELIHNSKIAINSVEHEEYRWVTENESLQIELIHDLAECNRLLLTY